MDQIPGLLARRAVEAAEEEAAAVRATLADARGEIALLRARLDQAERDLEEAYARGRRDGARDQNMPSIFGMSAGRHSA